MASLAPILEGDDSGSTGNDDGSGPSLGSGVKNRLCCFIVLTDTSYDTLISPPSVSLHSHFPGKHGEN